MLIVTNNKCFISRSKLQLGICGQYKNSYTTIMWIFCILIICSLFLFCCIFKDTWSYLLFRIDQCSIKYICGQGWYTLIYVSIMHMIAYPYPYENSSCSRMGLRYQFHTIVYIHILVSKFTFILDRPISLLWSKYTDTPPHMSVLFHIFPEKDRLLSLNCIFPTVFVLFIGY